MKKILVLFCSVLLALSAFAQEDVSHTMGYSTIKLNFKGTKLMKRYIVPGKDPVCGFYSSYSKTLFLADGKQVKVENTDYLYDALGACCTEMNFNDGPRPYAMMELPLQITKVDYETNTIYAKCDGADVVIETFNHEIDAWYKRFGKRDAMTPLFVKVVLRNWHYTPESEDSYASNTKKYRRKVKFKSKPAKNKEAYLHESEYMR